MKIDSASKMSGGPSVALGVANSTPNPGSSSSVAARSTPATASATPPAGLQVELSRTAGLKQAGEVFNTNRVAEIRQAIAEGRFQINPERIADGLLDSVRTMLSRQQPDAHP